MNKFCGAIAKTIGAELGISIVVCSLGLGGLWALLHMERNICSFSHEPFEQGPRNNINSVNLNFSKGQLVCDQMFMLGNIDVKGV